MDLVVLCSVARPDADIVAEGGVADPALLSCEHVATFTLFSESRDSRCIRSIVRLSKPPSQYFIQWNTVLHYTLSELVTSQLLNGIKTERVVQKEESSN